MGFFFLLVLAWTTHLSSFTFTPLVFLLGRFALQTVLKRPRPFGVTRAAGELLFAIKQSVSAAITEQIIEKSSCSQSFIYRAQISG